MPIRFIGILLLAGLTGCASGIDRSGFPANSIGGNTDIPLAPLEKRYPRQVVEAALETPYKEYVHVHGTVREHRVADPEIVQSSGNQRFDERIRRRLAEKYFPSLRPSGHRRPAVSIHAIRYDPDHAPGGYTQIVLTKIYQPVQRSRSMPAG